MTIIKICLAIKENLLIQQDKFFLNMKIHSSQQYFLIVYFFNLWEFNETPKTLLNNIYIIFRVMWQWNLVESEALSVSL